MSFSVNKNAVILTRGDTFIGQVNIKNPDGTDYIPVEGDTIRFALKKKCTDMKVLIEKKIPIDTLLLVLDPKDTKPLAFGTYVYDIQLTKANGDVDTFITKSPFMIAEEVK